MLEDFSFSLFIIKLHFLWPPKASKGKTDKKSREVYIARESGREQ